MEDNLKRFNYLERSLENLLNDKNQLQIVRFINEQNKFNRNLIEKYEATQEQVGKLLGKFIHRKSSDFF